MRRILLLVVVALVSFLLVPLSCILTACVWGVNLVGYVHDLFYLGIHHRHEFAQWIGSGCPIT